MELSPLIKFEMVVKASLCMFIDRPSWTMQSIDPLCAFLVNFVFMRPRKCCIKQSAPESCGAQIEILQCFGREIELTTMEAIVRLLQREHNVEAQVSQL